MGRIETVIFSAIVLLGASAAHAALPSAPNSPLAVEGNSLALLSWNTPNNGGSTIVDYQVQAFANGSTTATIIRSGVTTISKYKFTGLSNGTRYTFKVRARNIDGYGPFSNNSTSIIPTLYGFTDSPGLKYFGAPTIQNDQLSYQAELKRVSNAVGIIYNPADLRSFNEAVSQASSSFRMIIFINSIVRSSTAVPLSNSTITTNLTTLKSRLGTKAQYVLTFALDEPVWNAHYASCVNQALTFSACITAARTTNLHASVSLEVENIARMIRTTFPGAKVGVVESGVVLNTTMVLPRTLDLYGFDCYPGTPENCYGKSASWMNTTLRDKLVALNNSDAGSRRTLHIPQASVLIDAPSGDFYVGATIAKYTTDAGALGFGKALAAGEALRVVDFYYSMAKSDPLSLAFSAWIYEGFAEGNGFWLGYRNLPTVHTRINQIANEITLKSPAAISAAPVIEFHISRGKVGSRLLYAWSAPTADYCVSVSEPGTGNFPNSDWISSAVQTAALNSTYTIRCTNSYGSTTATRPVVVDP